MPARATLLLAALIALAAALPAAAHVPVRAAASQWGELGPFAQQPLPLPVQRNAEPPIEAVPRAQCGPGSKPEPGMQGRLSAEDVASGAAEDGYWCNVTRVGQTGSTGGFKTLRYVDEAGRECAYYDTTLLFPTNSLSLSAEPTGVAVLDMSNPANPVRTDSLLTPAMQTPHESLNISIARGLLVAVMGNPAFAPGVVDVYDLTQDCRHPVLKASAPVGWLGHESGIAPDGKTFYSTSIGTGQVTAVSLDNPSLPLPLWIGQYDSHGMTVSDDGNRGYIAAGSGLIILDLSELQSRKPDPQVREISRLVWSNMTIPQVAHPVTIGGRPYLVEVDEYSTSEGTTSVTAHGPRVGAARIIDISDETKPRVVSNIRLEVHQPENREAIAADPGAQNPTQGYAGHYCGIPSRVEPGIVACSMINSGLRVFDIRDPERPKEIAYHYSPPSTISATGGPVIDERGNWAMSQPAFVPERGEIWYTDGQAGFYALKVDPSVWPFPAAGSCGRAAVRLPRVKRGRVVKAVVRRKGRRIAARKGRDLRRVRVPRAEQPRTVKVHLRIERRDGQTRRVTVKRRVPACP